MDVARLGQLYHWFHYPNKKDYLKKRRLNLKIKEVLVQILELK